jgi:hypothetical protein
MPNNKREVKLSDEDKKVIETNVAAMQKVLRKYKVDIQTLVGLVTKSELEATKAAVDVRFCEEAALVAPMVMVAFD